MTIGAILLKTLADALGSALVGVFRSWLASVQAEQLGASKQAQRSTEAAEAQEVAGRAAGAAVQTGDDADDGFMRRD